VGADADWLELVLGCFVADVRGELRATLMLFADEPAGALHQTSSATGWGI
jgi:hypothetical protein